MADTIAIVTRGLLKSYGKVQALRGVDLEVQRSEGGWNLPSLSCSVRRGDSARQEA